MACRGGDVLAARPYLVLRVLEAVLPTLEAESPERRLWIVEQDRIRVRI
jgi:hypothetical protein